MSALERTMLRLLAGLPPNAADAEEFGRLFDAAPLYGVDEPMTGGAPVKGCHADCAIGPNADHHGTMSYRCMGERGESLPFPGEPFTTYDMGGHTMYLFPEDDG